MHDELQAHAAVFEQGSAAGSPFEPGSLEVPEEICQKIRGRAETALGIPRGSPFHLRYPHPFWTGAVQKVRL